MLLIMLVIVHVSAYGFHGDEAARIVDCVVGFTAFPAAEAIPLRNRLQDCVPAVTRKAVIHSSKT